MLDLVIIIILYCNYNYSKTTAACNDRSINFLLILVHLSVHLKQIAYNI